MLNERRRGPRQKSLLGGKVIFDNHNCSMDCTVRNLSDDGALIVSTESYRMPREFDFANPGARGGISRDDRMAEGLDGGPRAEGGGNFLRGRLAAPDPARAQARPHEGTGGRVLDVPLPQGEGVAEGDG